MNDDQRVTITPIGEERHYAYGTPSLIYNYLTTGQEVVCVDVVTDGYGEQQRREYILRLSPGTMFTISYDVAETEVV